MGSSGLVFNEWVAQVATKAVTGLNGGRTEPILDQHKGEQAGLLVEAPLERVVVCGREQAALSLSDINEIKRVIARTQARRAILYVPADTSIPNPVALLATLSKIEIVRMVGANQVK